MFDSFTREFSSYTIVRSFLLFAAILLIGFRYGFYYRVNDSVTHHSFGVCPCANECALHPSLPFYAFFPNIKTFNRNRKGDISSREEKNLLYVRDDMREEANGNSSRSISKGLHFLCELNIKVTIMVDANKKIIFI